MIKESVDLERIEKLTLENTKLLESQAKKDKTINEQNQIIQFVESSVKKIYDEKKEVDEKIIETNEKYSNLQNEKKTLE